MRARNIEIKARVEDLDALRARVAVRAARAQVLDQTDTFFRVPHGRLKLRRFGDGAGELIFYERPDVPGPKQSSYLRHACPHPDALSRVLAASLGVRGVVAKRREVYLCGQTRVHLDEVRGLGTFLEIEVVLGTDQPAADGERIAATLLRSLDIPEAALVPRAYIDLLDGAA